MQTVLVDTDIAIDYLRGTDYARDLMFELWDANNGGETYRLNRKKGTTLTSIDCLVYSTAVIRGHKIATRNKSHYPDKKILLSLQTDPGE